MSEEKPLPVVDLTGKSEVFHALRKLSPREADAVVMIWLQKHTPDELRSGLILALDDENKALRAKLSAKTSLEAVMAYDVGKGDGLIERMELKSRLKMFEEAAKTIIYMDETKVIDDGITPPCNVRPYQKYEEAINLLRKAMDGKK